MGARAPTRCFSIDPLRPSWAAKIDDNLSKRHLALGCSRRQSLSAARTPARIRADRYLNCECRTILGTSLFLLFEENRVNAGTFWWRLVIIWGAARNQSLSEIQYIPICRVSAIITECTEERQSWFKRCAGQRGSKTRKFWVQSSKFFSSTGECNV